MQYPNWPKFVLAAGGGGEYLRSWRSRILAALLTGLLAGFVHVLAGPDHLAAVAPLAAEDRARGVRTGARWGLGHAAGVVLVGLIALLLRSALPLEALSGWSERLVGVVLIGIGLWGGRRALRLAVHVHEHEHDGDRHQHIHVHGPQGLHAHDGPEAHSHAHAAFGIGVLHGLAGSAHFLGVLPALALPTMAASVAYVAAFGAGSVAAMAAFAGVIALLATRFSAAGTRGTRAYRALLVTLSAAAVCVGFVWLAA